MSATLHPHEFPIEHLNGSGKQNLMRDLMAAHEALLIACDKLARCSPHPRDYYVGTSYPANLQTAQAAHAERFRTVDRIYKEIEALALHVNDWKDR